MVKRYDSKSSGQMEGCLDGRYIRFEDYDALRTKLDRLIEYIEGAEHAAHCASRRTIMVGGINLTGNMPIRPYEIARGCNCWKAAALAEVGR